MILGPASAKASPKDRAAGQAGQLDADSKAVLPPIFGHKQSAYGRGVAGGGGGAYAARRKQQLFKAKKQQQQQQQQGRGGGRGRPTANPPQRSLQKNLFSIKFLSVSL